MNKLFKTFAICLLVFSYSQLSAQESKRAQYEQGIQQLIEMGTYEPAECDFDKRLKAETTGDKTIGCDRTQAYGTAGLVSSDATANANGTDPACPIFVPSSCSGTSTFRIPIAITVFEDPTWTGQNYLDLSCCGGSASTGFETLTNTDIDDKIAELNATYANANMEFYESVARSRVTDADLYNFYRTAADPEDGVEDDGATAAFDVPNVINIYFVGGMDGDHDCCGTTGYAPLPPSRDYFIMVYRGTFGTTFEHEFGHYFGLYHTHRNATTGNDNPAYPPDGNENNSDCLTTGDFICDTWPDPNFTNCRNSSCTYQVSAPNCQALTIDPASGVDQGGGVSTILENNIMSYNSFSGCRTAFTPCQLSKVQDILQGCRNNLAPACAYTPTDFFASADDQLIEICVGGTVPDFVANNGCHVWYAAADDGVKDILSEGNTFNAVSDGGVDNSVAGSHTFYVGKADDYQSGGTCRLPVTVNVLEDVVGDGSTASSTMIVESGTVDLTTTGMMPDDGEVIGWLITTTDPAGETITNQTELDAYIATGTMMESTTDLTDLSYDVTCAGSETYYAVPVLSLDDVMAPDDFSAGPIAITDAISNTNGTVTSLDVEVSLLPSNAVLTQVCLDITHQVIFDLDYIELVAPDGTVITLANSFFFEFAIGDIDACFVDDGSGYTGFILGPCNGASTCMINTLESEESFGSFIGNPNGTWTLRTSDFFNVGFSGTLNNVELVFDQAPVSTTFPTVSYTDCVLGDPVTIICQAGLPISLTSFDGKIEAQSIVLDWETESEINNDYFTLEHSTDGYQFELLTTKKGAGSTQLPQKYQYIDLSPSAGINYYRLKQTDFDGTTVTVKTITVDYLKDANFRIHPNPVKKEQLNINYNTLTSGQLEVEIIDMHGKRLTSYEFFAQKGENNFDIRLNNLSNGVYIIRTHQNDIIKSLRFVKM